MASDGLHGLGRRSALGLAGAGVSGVATILTIVIASRSLSLTGLGQFFVATAVFAIAQGFCSLGIDSGLQYWLPTLSPQGGRRLLRSTLPLAGVIGCAGAVLCWVGARPFAHLLSEDGRSGSTSLLRATALLIPFAGFYEVVFGALRACDRVKQAVMLDRVARPSAQVIAMLGVWVLGGSATQMLFAWSVPFVATACYAGYLVAQPAAVSKLNGELELVSPREFWKYTTPRIPARAAQVLTQRVDVVLIGILGSVRDAGIYGAVSRCMIAGVFVATAVQQVVQPRLRRLVVKGDTDGVKTMYGASTTWLVIATWPFYLLMAIFAPIVLKIFGTRFESGHVALTILCLTMLVASACGSVDVVLLMIGKSWISTVNILAALALNIILNLLLIPHFGMTGAAIAWSAAILTTNLAPLIQVARHGIHPGGVPLSTAMVVTSAGVGLPLLIGRLLGGLRISAFATSIVAALFIFGVVVTLTRHKLLLDRFFSDLSVRESRPLALTSIQKNSSSPRALRRRMSEYQQHLTSGSDGAGIDLLSILRRQIRVLAICAGLGLLAALALIFTSNPQFHSEAKVQILPLKGDVAPGGGLGRTVPVETQAVVAKSTKVIAVVAESLGLPTSRVQKSVSAEPAPTGDILLLGYSDDDAQVAYKGAKTFADEYLKQREANGLALIDTTRSTLEDNITRLQTELDGLAVKINEIKAIDPNGTSVELQSLLQVQDLTIRQNQTAKESLAALKTSLEPGRIVNEPVVPNKRDGLSKPLTLAGGLMAGLLAGLALALVRDRKDDRYRSAADLGSLGIAEIGRVPYFSRAQLIGMASETPERRAYSGLLIQVCFLSGLPGGAFKSLQLLAVESKTLPASAARNLADALTFEAAEGGTAMAVLPTSTDTGAPSMDTGSLWEAVPLAITDLAAEHDIVMAISPPLDKSMNGVAVASLVDRTILLVSQNTPMAEIRSAMDGMRTSKSVSIVVVTGVARAVR